MGLQDATADDANAADDDLYLVNQRLTAALDGTRQELFDVYQRVFDQELPSCFAGHQPLWRADWHWDHGVTPHCRTGTAVPHAG